jgi:hypothetical protein
MRRLISFAEAEKELQLCDSYTRLRTLLLLTFKMHESSFYRLLGEYWCTFDNTSSQLEMLADLLLWKTPVEKMMTHKERRLLAALPDRITIYRGCGKKNIRGISWTLNRRLAEAFPFFGRFRVERPLLVAASVDKRDVAALKIERNEDEIICSPWQILSIEPISPERGEESAQQWRSSILRPRRDHKRMSRILIQPCCPPSEETQAGAP